MWPRHFKASINQNSKVRKQRNIQIHKSPPTSLYRPSEEEERRLKTKILVSLWSEPIITTDVQ